MRTRKHYTFYEKEKRERRYGKKRGMEISRRIKEKIENTIKGMRTERKFWAW
jgi:hypothetical protein